MFADIIIAISYYNERINTMGNKICKDCKHFRQHYVKFGRRYDAIGYGHCVYPRLKKRETDETACERYKERKKEE